MKKNKTQFLIAISFLLAISILAVSIQLAAKEFRKRPLLMLTGALRKELPLVVKSLRLTEDEKKEQNRIIDAIDSDIISGKIGFRETTLRVNDLTVGKYFTSAMINSFLRNQLDKLAMPKKDKSLLKKKLVSFREQVLQNNVSLEKMKDLQNVLGRWDDTQDTEQFFFKSKVKLADI